jgi:hypothetical protein
MVACDSCWCVDRLLYVLRVLCCCSKIAEAEAAVFGNEKKWLVMHMHVQLKLDELRGPPNEGAVGMPRACCM